MQRENNERDNFTSFKVFIVQQKVYPEEDIQIQKS